MRNKHTIHAIQREIVTFELNPQNKTLANWKLSLDIDKMKSICWKNTDLEIVIDMHDMAFTNIESLNTSIFVWLKHSKVKSLYINIKNISEEHTAQYSNSCLFNSLIDQLVPCDSLEYIKFSVCQFGMFEQSYFEELLGIKNLKVLDFSDFYIKQQDGNHHLIFIINLLNTIEQDALLKTLILPTVLRDHEVTVEYGFENQFLEALTRAFTLSSNLIEIGPLPKFIELQDDIQHLFDKRQGEHLQELYNENDQDNKTLALLRAIPNPTPEISEIIAAKASKFEEMCEDVLKLCSIINSMKPKNLYWLDQILREKLQEPKYILSCLKSILRQKQTHEDEQALFKMLHGIIGDILSGRFQEVDPANKQLTEFMVINVRPEEIDKINTLRTLLKIHAICNISCDDDLSLILCNMLEEFVYGGIGGVKFLNDDSRLVARDHLNDFTTLIINLLSKLEKNYHETTMSNKIYNDETNARLNICYAQDISYNHLLYSFINFQNFNHQQQNFRNRIIYEQQQEQQELLYNFVQNKNKNKKTRVKLE